MNFEQFGGLLPSVDRRRLPAGAAQVAHNLDLRFGGFRPTRDLGGSLATVENGAQSVFRTAIGGVWLSSALQVDYAPAQGQDEGAPERVYLTGRSAYPEAWQGGSYRRLGVPQPTTAPTATLNAVFQFTADDAVKFKTATVAKWTAAIEAGLSDGYAGYSNAIAGPFADGAYWLPHGTATTPALPTVDARMGCYCVPVTAAGSSYKVVNPDAHSFAVNPALGGTVVSYSGQSYLAIPMVAKATVWDWSTAAFKASAQTIQNPQGTAQLVANANLDTIGAEYAKRFDRTEPPRRDLVADMDGLVAQVANIVNPPTAAMLKQQVTDFYASASVTAAIDKAAELLANSLYEVAATVWAAEEGDASGMPPSDIIINARLNPL